MKLESVSSPRKFLYGREKCHRICMVFSMEIFSIATRIKRTIICIEILERVFCLLVLVISEVTNMILPKFTNIYHMEEQERYMEHKSISNFCQSNISCHKNSGVGFEFHLKGRIIYSWQQCWSINTSWRQYILLRTILFVMEGQYRKIIFTVKGKYWCSLRAVLIACLKRPWLSFFTANNICCQMLVNEWEAIHRSFLSPIILWFKTIVQILWPIMFAVKC